MFLANYLNFIDLVHYVGNVIANSDVQISQFEFNLDDIGKHKIQAKLNLTGEKDSLIKS